MIITDFSLFVEYAGSTVLTLQEVPRCLENRMSPGTGTSLLSLVSPRTSQTVFIILYRSVSAYNLQMGEKYVARTPEEDRGSAVIQRTLLSQPRRPPVELCLLQRRSSTQSQRVIGVQKLLRIP